MTNRSFGLMERIKSSLLPRAMTGNLFSEARTIALDKRADPNERCTAINFLGYSRHGVDFFGDFLDLAIDTETIYAEIDGDCGPQELAARFLSGLYHKIQLKGRDDVSEKATEQARSAIIKLLWDTMKGNPRSWTRVEYIMGEFYFGDDPRKKVTLDYNCVDNIANALRDKSYDERIRESVMCWCRRELTIQDPEYICFTNATIEIAEDTTNSSLIRVEAVRTLDPVKHKDHLWELRKDPDIAVRREAIQILNCAAIAN